MPRVFVVTDEPDIVAVAKSLLGARVAAAKRDAAIDAIRRANPALDLDRLQPGAVVFVPEGPDMPARTAGAGPADPVADALDDLVARTSDALAALAVGFDAGEERRRADAEATVAVLKSPEVRKATAGNPALKENTAAVARTLAADDAAAGKDREAMGAAQKDWLEQLAVLRGQAGGGAG